MGLSGRFSKSPVGGSVSLELLVVLIGADRIWECRNGCDGMNCVHDCLLVW